MHWQEKFAAMRALVGHYRLCLRMRGLDDWYVEAIGREVGGNGFLEGRYGNGATPQAAVEDDWRQLVENLEDDRYVVIKAGTYLGRRFRWNGFMWNELPQEEEEGNAVS